MAPSWPVLRSGFFNAACLIGACAATVSDAQHMAPLRGEYGFLSQFSGLTEDEARRRVRRMVVLFGIKEFEFYNAFEGYSHPPWVGKQHWRCTCLGTKVERSVLLAYTDEIRKHGGRSWLSVQAMGADPGQAADATVLGQMKINDKPLFDVVAPNAARAESFVPAWAAFASSLGFSGILWGTLGDYDHHSVDHGSDLPGFLRASLQLLQAKNLDQTCNFVGGFGWNQGLVQDGVVAFTYWSASEGCSIDMKQGSVYVCAGAKATDMDTLVRRWRRARCVGSSYLAMGDGSRRLRTDYYPDATDLTEEDMIRIKGSVFDSPTCGPEPSTTAEPVATITLEPTATAGAITLEPTAAAGAAAASAAAMAGMSAPNSIAIITDDAHNHAPSGGVVALEPSGGGGGEPTTASTGGDGGARLRGNSACGDAHGDFIVWASKTLGVGCDASAGVKRKMAGMWAIWAAIFVFLAILVGQATGCESCCARRTKRHLLDSEEYAAATLAS